MGERVAEGVYFHKLNPISTTGGSVLHAIKSLDENLPQFGECYFSTVEGKLPKAWKKHTRMICNLFVPFGAVRFVFYDDRQPISNHERVTHFVLSAENYGRLIIHPGIWFGFAGQRDETSIILNVANIAHTPDESFRIEPGNDVIPFNWESL